MKTYFILLLLSLPLAAEPRVFTDNKGRPLAAELLKTSDTKAWLKLESGKTVSVEKTTLSETDRTFITQWEADRLPDIKVEPNLVRSNSKEGDASSDDDSRKQKFSMAVKLTNLSSTKDLEESEIIYFLIGKSTTDRSYKVLARQVATTSVPAKGTKSITFKEIDNHYKAGRDYKSGHKGLGYVLLIQRKRDARRIYLNSPTALLKSSLENISRLKTGDVTESDFIKAPPKTNPETKKEEPDSIIIR